MPFYTHNVPAVLKTYKRVLPSDEWAAFKAWQSAFYPFQQEWLFDLYKFAICNKARQIGTSFTTSAVAILWAVFHAETTTIVSIGEKESKEVLEKALRHAQVLQALGSRMARFGDKKNTNELSFVGGGRILALPSSGPRGFTGNLFLDECAYLHRPDEVWDAAAPTTSLGFKIRVVSTPNGVGNFYEETWTDALEKPDLGYSMHEIPIQKAIAQGYPVNLKDCWRIAKGDPRIFDQMYNCSFLDNILQFIPTQVINDAVSDEEIREAVRALENGQGQCFAGLDIGREVDRTCLTILLLVGDKRYIVRNFVCRRTDWDGLSMMVDQAFDRFKLRRLCIDSTGLGSLPAAAIKKKHSERIDVPHRRPRVECIDFTLNSKEGLVTGLYAALASKSVVLPKTDEFIPELLPGTAQQIRKDLAALKRIITPAGNVTYDAPRTKSGHADNAWSLALAVHGCSAPNAMLDALLRRTNPPLLANVST